jgi:hypothetical protein
MHTTIEQAIKELPADAVKSIITEYIENFREALINITDEHAHSYLELTQFKERVLSRLRFLHASTYKQWLLHTIPQNLLINLKTNIEDITEILRHKAIDPDETIITYQVGEKIVTKSMERPYTQQMDGEKLLNYAKDQYQRSIDQAKLLAEKKHSTLTSSSVLFDSSLLNSSLLNSSLLNSSLFRSSAPVVTTHSCEESDNPSSSQSTSSNISSNISSQNTSATFSHYSQEERKNTYLIDKDLLCFIFAVIHYREAMNTKEPIVINGILIQPNPTNLEHITIDSGASEIYKACPNDCLWLFTIFQEKLKAALITNHFNSNTEILGFKEEEPHILSTVLDKFLLLILQGSLITEEEHPYQLKTLTTIRMRVHLSDDDNKSIFLEKDLIEPALDGSIVPINSISDLQDITNSQTVKCD